MPSSTIVCDLRDALAALWTSKASFYRLLKERKVSQATVGRVLRGRYGGW
jgi:hypothetical protein